MVKLHNFYYTIQVLVKVIIIVIAMSVIKFKAACDGSINANDLQCLVI